MKKDKIIYWVTTFLVALSGIIAGIMYMINPNIITEFTKLGFPDYFRIELAIAKLIGALVLLFPFVSDRIKEWAYVGFAITFISALIAHIMVDVVSASVSPLISLVLLVVSYVYFTKLKT